MARIKELHGSRIGETRGLDGATGTNRIFQVIAEPEDIVARPDGLNGFLDPLLPDPFFLLTDVPSGGLASLKIDSEYPWDTTQTVRNYTVLDSPAPGHWIIRIDYGRPVGLAVPPANRWIVSSRGVTITKEIIEEFPLSISTVNNSSDKGVRFDELDPTLPDVDAESSRLLGTVVFEESKDQEAAATTANYVAGDVFLDATKRRQGRRVNADVPALSVTFTRTAANFSISINGILIASSMRMVNRTTFLGAAPGFVMCTDITVDPIAAEIPGQTVPGEAHRISVSFLWSAETWTPDGRVATFVDKKGTTQFVKWNQPNSQHRVVKGNKVVEYFRVRRTGDLGKLLQILSRQ